MDRVDYALRVGEAGRIHALLPHCCPGQVVAMADSTARGMVRAQRLRKRVSGTRRRCAYSQYAARQVRDLIERYEPCVVWNDINWPDAGQHDGTLDDLRAFYTGAIFAGLTLATVPLILLYLVLAEALRAEGLRFARRRVTWSDTERILTMHPDEGISRGFAQAIRGTAVDGGTIHLRQAGD